MINFLFLFILIFTPLAFGTVETWSLTMMEIAVFTITILLLYKRYFKRNKTIYWPPGFLPLLIFVAYIFFQIIELPSFIVEVLSPSAFNLRQKTIGQVEPVTWQAISLNRKDTLIEFFRFSAYACMYFTTVHLLQKKNPLQKYSKAVVLIGSAIALQSLLQKASADNLLLWIRQAPPYSVDPMGPYAYHNHFAGFMEMLCPLALSLFLYSASPQRPNTSEGNSLVAFFSQENFSSKILLYFAPLLIAVSILVSASRGGVISLFVGILCLYALLKKNTDAEKLTYSAISLSIISIIIAGWFGWNSLFISFLNTFSTDGSLQDGRIQIWQNVLVMAKDYGLSGSGLGTIKQIFPNYGNPPHLDFHIHAHNDYLELLTTGGLPSLALTGCFFISLLYKSFKGISKADTFSKYIFCGALAGILAILAHSVIDFNFSCGANALYFFFLCGALAAAAHTAPSRQKNHHNQLPQFIAPKGISFSMIILIVLLSSSLYFQGRNFIAATNFKSVNRASLPDISEEELTLIKSKTARLINLDKLESKYHFTAGKIAYLQENYIEATKHLQQAAVLTPANGEIIQHLGITLDLLGHKYAENLIEEGVRLNRQNILLLKTYTAWLQNNKNHDKAVQIMANAIMSDQKNLYKYLPIIDELNLDPEKLLETTILGISPLLQVAGYFDRKKHNNAAKKAYGRSIELIKNNAEGIMPKHLIQVSDYFKKNKQFDIAIEQLNIGLVKFPQNSKINFTLGELYNKTGDKLKAEIEYKKAVEFDKEWLQPRLRLAAGQDSDGTFTEAEQSYINILQIIKKSSKAEIWHINQVYNFFKKYKNYKLAHEAALAGYDLFSDNTGILLNLGDSYTNQYMNDLAEETYKKILKIDPDNEKAKLSLKKLQNAY